jgi:hypothetical protein
MNHANLVQAVRGPILLITVGALIALDYAGSWSFSRTWPLIIIVIGVMKLAERLVAPPLPPQPYVSVPPGFQPPPPPYNAPQPPYNVPPQPPLSGGLS